MSYGYTVILCNSDEDAIKEIQYIDTLQQKLVAGFIITTNQHNKNYYETLNVPIVALDRAFHSSFPTVSTNNLEGALIGTKHLIESGCRNIACLRGPEGLIPADDRLKGFLKLLYLLIFVYLKSYKLSVLMELNLVRW